MNQKNIIISIVAVLVLVGGFYLKNRTSVPVVTNKTEPIVCTEDIKQCSDGSSVGRTGPNCEFVCPDVTNMRTKLDLYVQDKELSVSKMDCAITKKITIEVPKTVAVANESLKILFAGELSKYGVYKSVTISDGVAKVYLQSDLLPGGTPIGSLSSCESQHLISVLNDTLKQYNSIKTVEIHGPKGKIEF